MNQQISLPSWNRWVLGLLSFCIAISTFDSRSCNAAEKLPSRLWNRKMRGAITDLSFARNGKSVLVATSPDHDIEGSASSYLLSRLDSSGRLSWESVMKSPVKEIDISADGSLSVVSNYGNELFGQDASGKRVWMVETMCKPQIINYAKKILCYHDDDADPKIAFELFDWKGKKLLSYPIETDIMALKLSADEKNLAIALSGGEIVLFGSDFLPVWKKRVDGEISDIAISSGESPKLAVLAKGKKKSQEVIIMDSGGAILNTIVPAFKAVQLELNPQGDFVFFYGNSSEGQHIAGVSMKEAAEGNKDGWKYGSPFPTEYSYIINVDQTKVVFGFEDISPLGRKSRLLAFHHDGKLLWDLPLASDEGSYLYTHRIAFGTPVVAVGTDDAQVSVFRSP